MDKLIPLFEAVSKYDSGDQEPMSTQEIVKLLKSHPGWKNAAGKVQQAMDNVENVWAEFCKQHGIEDSEETQEAKEAILTSLIKPYL